MSSHSRWGSAALLVALPAIFSQPAAAQVLYGTLVGTIEDSSRAIIAGATVTVSSESIGQSRQITTDTQGRFQVVNLLPGLYEISVRSAGFRLFRQTNVEITINTVTRVDVQLQVGEVTESVTVAATGAKLQTSQSDVHVELGRKEVAELPLPMYRNYQSLVNLVPGATPARTQNATIGSPGRALSTNVNGTTRNNNNNRLDGANNIRATLPHQAHYIPPAESIETVNIATNSFDAEQGFAGGVAVNVVTKSGTNQMHGTLFEHHANSAMRARDFFFIGSKSPKNILNMYGGTIGGPVKRDKLFYFGSFEGLRERQNASARHTVATADQRTGNFSAYNAMIFDPLSGDANGRGRTAFPTATIPLVRQSAVTRKMQDLVPLPNLPGTSNNYFASKPVIFDRDQIDAKMNWTVSAKTNVWGKYSAMSSDVTSQPQLDRAGGAGLPWGAGTGDILGQLATLAGTHLFTPSLLMDATLGFARMAVQDRGFDFGQNFGLETLGIPGTNGPDPRQGGIPHFVSPFYSDLGQVDSWMPKILFDNTWTLATNFNWNRGKHDIRFGVDIAREQQNHWHPETGGNGPRGRFRFEGAVTSLRDGPPVTQFNSWATFLLGMPQGMGKALQFFDPMSPREWRHGYYLRDRWQATRSLTINLGLRWEYYPLMTFANNGMVRYDAETNQVLVGRLGGIPDTVGVSISKWDFGPRVGLAYRMGQSSVLRAGYGISVDPVPMSAGFFMLDPFPAVVNADFTGANSWTPAGRIENGIPLFSGPDIGAGRVEMPRTVTTKTLEGGAYNRGYIQSFNFVLERQLPWNLIGSVGYVATRTVGQLGIENINASVPGGGTAGRPLFTRFGRSVDTSVFKHFLSGRYDSLQANVDRRFSNGLLLKVAYTWGKALNHSDDSGGGLMWNVPSERYRNWAVAGYDRPHNVRAAWLCELPFGSGKRWASENALARVVLGGWQMNGIFSAYTGTPFTVTASGAALNAPGNSQTADQVASEVRKLGGVGPQQKYFDPGAFAPVRDARFGTGGRNILRGPGIVNLDLSAFRDFAVRERWKLQFRAESFNFTNTPHFSNPNANVESTAFMEISSTVGESANLEGLSRGFRFGVRLSF